MNTGLVLSPQPSPTSRVRSELAAGLLAAGVSIAAIVVAMLAVLGGVRLSNWLTPRQPPPWHPRLAALPPLPAFDVEAATHGRDVFMRTCANCHGPRGFGKPGLGQDLVRSDFIADRGDAQLVAFVLRGRPANDPQSITGIAMPPKGGFPDLTEEEIAAAVSYLRGLQDPRRLPELPTWVPPAIVVSAEEKAAALVAAGGDAELAEWIASGNKLFHSTCIVCHGKDGVGVPGNGKALVHNEFIQSLDDEALLAFLQKGRSPTDPRSTTGIQMPPKGGNPAMSEDDLLDIIAFLRTLQPAGAGGAGGVAASTP